MTETNTLCIRVSDAKICPFCHSDEIIKNGKTKTKKQQFYCKKCSNRFLDFYTYNAYCKNINQRITQYINEGLGIRSIARILKISTTILLKRILLIAKNISQPLIPKGKRY